MIPECFKTHNLLCAVYDIQKISQFKRKHASVPFSALVQKCPGFIQGRLFLETVHGPGNQPAIYHRMGFRNNIAILLRRIGGFNPHKYHVSNSRLYGLFHLHHCVKILNIRKWVHWQRQDNLIPVHLPLLCQIDGRQGNCGKCITAFRLHHHIHILTQLAADGVYL